MKKTFLSALLLATALTTGGAKAETIFEALSTAYDTNPTLQAQRAYLRSVDENVAIAKSGFRPNIYLTGGYSDSDVHNNNVPSQTGGATLSAGAKISQPVFSGFTTVNSVKSADSMVRAEQNNLYNTEQGVFLDSSTAYLDVVRDEAIVNLQKNNEKLLKKRLDETVERFNVGEVTRTDVSQAQARYSQAKATASLPRETCRRRRLFIPGLSAKRRKICPNLKTSAILSPPAFRKLWNIPRPTTIPSAMPASC